MKRLLCLFFALLLVSAGCSVQRVPDPIIIQPPQATESPPAPTAPPVTQLPTQSATQPQLPAVTDLRDPEDYRTVMGSCYHAQFVLREDGVLLSCSSLYDDGTLLGRDPADPYDWKPVMKGVRAIHIPRDTFGMAEACFAITENDELWGWGTCVAFGSQATQQLPVKVMDNVAQVAMEGSMVYILDKDGTVWGCGALPDDPNASVEKLTPLANDVSALQTGRCDDPSVLLEYADGQVGRVTLAAQGKATVRQLPYPAVQHYENLLLTADGKVYDLSVSDTVPMLEKGVQVGGGRGNYCAVTGDDLLYVWKSPLDRPEGQPAPPMPIASDCRWLVQAYENNYSYLTADGDLHTLAAGMAESSALLLDQVLAVGPCYLRSDGQLWSLDVHTMTCTPLDIRPMALQ